MSATGVNLDPSGVFQFIEHEENKGPECVNQVSQQLGLSAVMTLIVVRNSKMLARSWTSYWIYWNRWARTRNSMDQIGGTPTGGSRLPVRRHWDRRLGA
jgi:hypothetical protein